MTVYYPQFPPISWEQPFFIIGLTGSMGAGKSKAASFFYEAGAKRLDADKEAKELLHSEGLRASLLHIFGANIWDVSVEKISEKYLSSIIFGDELKRKALNDLIHPLVEKRFELAVDALQADNILVYDIPLLFESSAHHRMDLNLVVDAPVEIRYERIQKRNGWDRKEFDRRESSQFSAKTKRQMADMVIVNHGNIFELEQSIKKIYTHVQKAKNEL